MEFRKIKIEEFEKLKYLLPDNEEIWIKYKNKRLQQLKNGVRIDIWTHFMRECIINYVY